MALNELAMIGMILLYGVIFWLSHSDEEYGLKDDADLMQLPEEDALIEELK